MADLTSVPSQISDIKFNYLRCPVCVNWKLRMRQALTGMNVKPREYQRAMGDIGLGNDRNRLRGRTARCGGTRQYLQNSEPLPLRHRIYLSTPSPSSEFSYQYLQSSSSRCDKHIQPPLPILFSGNGRGPQVYTNPRREIVLSIPTAGSNIPAAADISRFVFVTGPERTTTLVSLKDWLIMEKQLLTED